MDSFQGKPESAERIADSPSPIFVADVSGDVRIQLEGSHTSASVTESETPSQSKYVKFEDELNDRQINKDLTSSHNTVVQLNTETDNADDEASCTGRIPHKLWGAVDIIPRSSRRAEQQCDEWQSVQMQELKQIGKENKEITERFRQIMDMFDTFTRNLETLEPRAIGVKNRGNVVISDVADLEELRNSSEFRSICTTTSGLELNAQVEQPSFCENVSIGQSSLITLSGCTSKSELPQSLNNYANADNAMPRLTSTEIHPLSELKKESSRAADPAPLTAAGDLGNQSFHTIHIDTTSSPSSSLLQRPPLCQRLWDALTNFCASVCLCLQVNRDCIFCLGFFVAFVVTASFLTAFFYRTLSLSPPLLQPPTLDLWMDKTMLAKESNQISPITL